MVELFLPAQVVLGGSGAGIREEFIHLLAIRVRVGEFLAQVDDGYRLQLVRLGAVHHMRYLLIIDGQALARLGQVGLLGGLNIAGGQLRHAVIIGGL